jgi:osmotically-inducible protein OsmY
VRAALRRSPETRASKAEVRCDAGRVTLSGNVNTDQRLAMLEVVVGLPGVLDVAWRSHDTGEQRRTA